MSSKNVPETGSDIKSPKRKRKRKKDPYVKLPGVKKIPLSELTQKLLGCVAGLHLTIENPWMYIAKDRVQDNLELHEESADFLPIKSEILKYPLKELYIGYAADDSKDEDEFYFCTTPESVFLVKELYEKQKKEIEERLYNAINKTVREWTSLGSENEVDEALIRNNRPLIEVEVESGYPISPARAAFDVAPAETRRDGYMELTWTSEERVSLVYKRRIHAYVQVAPQYTTRVVQTDCTYPTNASTQYEYIAENPAPLLAKCAKPFKEYADENMEIISDMLRVNGVFNLYSEDYKSLIQGGEKFVSAIASEEVKEYMSFMDVELCKDKMISDVVFHPMWTGTVAVAYNDQAPYIFHSGLHNEDVVLKAVQGTNPVLIWSCLDSLKPKLILKSPREVIKLEFCKFNPNILVGGLRNGQIIIWDITNKLEQVEQTHILTTAQVKNRKYMRSLLSWMKIIHDVAVVPHAVVSDIKYSHKGPVTGIHWVSPFYEYTKLGRLGKLNENSDHQFSMQFISAGEDGTVLIWDLLRTPQTQPGGFKPRKLKRLKKKPSALMTDSSPLAVHNLNFTPVYKIIIPRQRKKPMAIASCHEDLCPMKYTEVNPTKGKKGAVFNERIIYEPVLDKDIYKPIKPSIHIGSMEGDYILTHWEGQDFDSGEMINSETGIIKSRAKYHDGPINSIQKNSVFDVTLTVGGRIFALWNEKLPNRPLIWRRGKTLYTSGEWNNSEPFLFTNKIQNGDVETWSLAYDSIHPSFSLTFSSGNLSASAFHTLKQRKTVYAAGDKLGSLRLFFMPEDSTPGTLETKSEKFQTFMEREIIRKSRFLMWQDNWNKRQAALQAILAEKNIEEEEEIKVEEIPKFEPKEETSKKEGRSKKKQQPGIDEYIQKILRRRQLDEEIRIKETIIAKKQLDTKELEKKRKPLQKLEEENERKKRKQKQRLKEGENIFIDTVSSLFPDAIKEKPPPPPDPYASTTITTSLGEMTFDDFLRVKEQSTGFIATHPYKYIFDWNNILANGVERREMLTDPMGEKKRHLAKRRATRVSTYSNNYDQDQRSRTSTLKIK